MKLIGLTGGIGCGKTTVLEEFQKLGVPCFVADRHAATYYEEDTFLAEIRSLFGDSVIRDDGKADKGQIASIVFNNREALLKLNALIHPRVMKDFADWAAAIKRDNPDTPYVVMESAIIFEYHLEKHLDQVITVYLEKEERIRRLMLRDKTTREQLENRMRNQLSAEEKMMLADYVILNYEGNPRSRQVATINKIINQAIHTPPPSGHLP